VFCSCSCFLLLLQSGATPKVCACYPETDRIEPSPNFFTGSERVQEQVCSKLQNGRKDVAEFAENSGNRRSVSAAPPEFCANSATNAFLRPPEGCLRCTLDRGYTP